MTELKLLRRIERNLRLWFTDAESGDISVRTQTAMSIDLEKLAKIRKSRAKLLKLKRKYDRAVVYLAENRKKIHPTLIKIAHKRLVEVKRRLDAGLK